MKMVLCAGAFALATVGLLSGGSQSRAMEIAAPNGVRGQAAINIPRIKSALKLTAAQEPYWTPVEAALRDLARKQTQTESAGLVSRISNRVVTVVLNSAAVQRLAVAARPLIGRLDADQMRTAQGLAQEMGLGPVVAALR
jgi:hypothetical protein